MSVAITIDLVSDTATKPTAGMREAMAKAVVGDEQRGEDPNVNALCDRVAAMLGMDAAVFLPSGIMSNLIAILVHCQRGDEIIAADNAHIIGSEGAGAAALAGTLITTIETIDGRFSAMDVASRIRPQRPRAPRTRLISIEQTSNKGGGSVWLSNSLASISDAVRPHGIAMHMDGARLMNAAVACNVAPVEFTRYFDSAWLDLSKGLGCPVGSVLCGSSAFIEEAWAWKHRLGGAMRQAGVLAAAGLYALDHHVERLVEDHANAKRFATAISELPGIQLVFDEIETNMVFFDVSGTGRSAVEVANVLKGAGIRIGAVNNSIMRAVTHLDVASDQIEQAVAVLGETLITA